MTRPPFDNSTLRHPAPESLSDAVLGWAREAAESDPLLLQVGYVGSFAETGSEEETHLDVVLLVEETDIPPAERVAHWDLADIPFPTQPLVYTRTEWEGMVAEGGWLARKLETEAVWVWKR